MRSTYFHLVLCCNYLHRNKAICELTYHSVLICTKLHNALKALDQQLDRSDVLTRVGWTSDDKRKDLPAKNSPESAFKMGISALRHSVLRGGNLVGVKRCESVPVCSG